MTLTPETVAALQALEQRATNTGEWQTRFIHRMFQAARQHPEVLMGTKPEQDWHDAAFIAEIRNAAPDLLAAASTLAQIQALRPQILERRRWEAAAPDGQANIISLNVWDAILALLPAPAETGR